MDKLRSILIVTSWYKTKESPIEGSFVEEQARMLQNRGWKITVLHCYLKGTFFGSLTDRKNETVDYVDKGIRVIRIGVSPVLPKFRSLSYNKLCRVAYDEFSNLNIKIDILHSHSGFMGGVVGRYFSKKMNVYQFHTEHTSGLIFRPEQYTSMDLKLLEKVYSNSKKVFFVSEYARAKITELHNIHGDNFSVLHNVVNPIFFTDEMVELNGSFSYLLIGNIIERKGVKDVLDSYKLLIQKFPDSILTIAGDGILKNNLKSYAQLLGIDKNVRWLPQLNRQEVKGQIALHHVVISASKLETFGLTIAESVSSGKPVVVMDSGGVRDIVNPTNGIICENDVGAFSEALCNIQENYKKYNSRKIRDGARDKFSEEIISNRLKKHYQKIIK